MIYFVCSVHDAAIGAFGRPAFVASMGQAIRSFTDEVNRGAEDNVMFKHPEDVSLYHLGTFDDGTGLFELVQVPRRICEGKSVSAASKISVV